MAGSVTTPYTTAVEFFGQKPSWIPDATDQQRIQSYQVYEDMYWNVPDTFKVSLRGTNSLPLYVPTARTIIDTTLRYYAPDFRVGVVDAVSGKDSNDSVAATMAIRDLFKREKIRSKMVGYKRYGLIHGDAVWHLTADASRPAGSRLTLTAIDPGMYFPIMDEEDADRRIGCHLAYPITTADGDRIRRVTYLKGDPRPDGTSTITVEEGIFKTDSWVGIDTPPELMVSPATELPPQITSLPVYHTKNFEEPGNPFGSSEARGLERIMGGVNQAVSDESLALALMGIGMYATDASHPIDPDTKKRVPWQLGPGRVVHHDGTKWERIQGVGNLADSYGTHYYRLWEALKQASSTPDIAIGSVDVQVASSGIALALQLGPMLAKAGEKNDLFLDTQNQLFYDILTMWMPAYEATTFAGISVDCVVGSAVPVDRQARFTELNDMLDRGIIDTEYYRTEAKKLGYVFPDTIGDTAKAEFDERNAQADPFATRLGSETVPANDGGAA
jgi:hypothetical protein